MENVFLDTDVVVDFLSGREPHHSVALRLLSAAHMKKIKIHVSVLSFANSHYILSKFMKDNIVRRKIIGMQILVTTLALNDQIFGLALSSDFKDFEDGIQYYTAIENNIHVIITRNLRDFRSSKIAVLHPEQYLNQLNIQ
ncbi:MAG TPA: PIN domain-containing protein [Bacteroidia bacterium]|nr:PIN domain-containing protein [Bacteroidia bacterium]